ncbi:unnamed protein product [Adineta ricciae]|uniref:Uncharacterized protein n=1 Tax=Adineta ricciae TaxID=249248 RepID=A0A814LGC1_ADIRI|nr:unnamed protein product [Adineta ricciae]CAF1135016.1 unnamed protein product [Adineta ricciae]
MASLNGLHAPSSAFTEPTFTNEHQLVLLNSEELRSKNREQLIEKLERVIQEKNASITKLEDREQVLEDLLKKRNAEFRALEEQLRQYEEKTRTFEQLHQLQVQTFEKTIRDCQSENERLFEHANDLTKQVRERSDFEAINQEKIMTFDRIAADTQLWRQKLDSYKAAVDDREETIAKLRREIIDLQKKKQTNGDFEDDSLKVHIATLQNTLRDRDNEIEHLKLTLRRSRDTSQSGRTSPLGPCRTCNNNPSRNSSATKPSRSSSQKKRRPSPPVRDVSPTSSPLDTEYLKKKIHTLTDRLANVQQLLVKRDDQIATLKKVHDKRWLRLKHLQKQYRSVKDELQSYTDDEALQKNCINDYFYGRAIRKNKIGCSVCNEQRRRRQTGANRKVLKHEDDDNVWNEVTKLRRENARLVNENVSLQEKIDLQEIEINEQTIVIGELRNEIQLLNDKDDQLRIKPPSPTVLTSNDDQQRLIEELDKKLYDLETERTCLLFEQERLKTNLDLCIDEKQHLLQQRTQTGGEMKKLKLRTLALQDQIYKLKRNNQLSTKKNTIAPSLIKKKRAVKKRASTSCLEMLLDQNPSPRGAPVHFPEEAPTLYRVSSPKTWRRPRCHACSLCNYHTESSLMKRKKRPSISNKTYGSSKKNARLSTSFRRDPYTQLTRKPTAPKSLTRMTTMRKRVEQLQMNLLDAKEENELLNQRLLTANNRVNMLKNTNQRLTNECDRLKNEHTFQPMLPTRGHQRLDSSSTDNSESIDNLYNRLKNTSFDAARQRKQNKTLQEDNETLTKNLQSLTEKLTHTERDIASKRTLIESYKSRLSDMENTVKTAQERNPHENDEERVKSLTEAMEKLKVSLESYKNRLQAITRDKQLAEARYAQLLDDHQSLKSKYDDLHTKHRLNEQQLRQYRLNHEHLNQELLTSRRLSEQQMITLDNKNQETLNKLSVELDRTRRSLNEHERFTIGLLHEMIRRSSEMKDSIKRAREHQKHRESLSLTLPGYDTALHTASKILNLTQDDLDDIMSTTEDSFHGQTKDDQADKSDKIRQKVSKLLVSQEEFAGKLLKIFSKKLDEIQAADRDLGMFRHT